ncbi:hypothetical protein SDC9_65841 [bioreactor metagenome]|uniref:Uncharacterized protein n=1 Tax=bioreactor metagenome TaxID=1076179 RepID=A0A644XU19_9ZZZZ
MHTECRLQRSVFIKLIKHLFGLGTALQLNDNAHAAAVRLIAQVRNGFDLAFAGQLCNTLNECGLVHLIRNLGDDDLVAVTLHLFDVGHTAHHQLSAASRVGLADVVFTNDHTAGGKIGTLDKLHQLFDRDRFNIVVAVDEIINCAGNLAQIVRGNAGGHTHCDAG